MHVQDYRQATTSLSTATVVDALDDMDESGRREVVEESSGGETYYELVQKYVYREPSTSGGSDGLYLIGRYVRDVEPVRTYHNF